MDAPLAFAALGGLVLLVGALAFALTRSPERSRPVSGERRVDTTALGVERLGSRATIVQLSTQMCARCPGVQRTIQGLVAHEPEIAFVHVDLTERPDLASALKVLQTPTVLLLDESGNQRIRLSGAISRESLTRELASLTGGYRVAR